MSNFYVARLEYLRLIIFILLNNRVQSQLNATKLVKLAGDFNHGFILSK